MINPARVADLYKKHKAGKTGLSNAELIQLLEGMTFIQAFLQDAGREFHFVWKDINLDLSNLKDYHRSRALNRKIAPYQDYTRAAFHVNIGEKQQEYEVVGGVRFAYDKEKEKKFLLVSDGASRELYRIENDSAVWYGSLCGTEQQRFDATTPGRQFKYKRTEYLRLRPSEYRLLYVPGHTYEFKHKPA